MKSAWALLAVAGLAVAGLALPAAPVYDAWSWLVWGRELTESSLDTSYGPSWKPLTVFLAAPLTLAGSSASELWLLVSRAGWLLAPLAAAVLARRVAGRDEASRAAAPWAAALAALGTALIFDPETAWIRQGAAGLSEPLLAALLCLAVERAIAGRNLQVLAIGFAAALLRPELWPLGAAYLAWLWRADRRSAAVGLALAALVPVAWIAPDLIGAGNPVEGPARARGGSFPDLATALRALGLALLLPPFALTLGAGLTFVRARGRSDRAVQIAIATAAGWVAIVAAMAFVGFAGLARFSAPAAALLCALGAPGLVIFIAAGAARRQGRATAVVAAAALLIADGAWRGALAGAELPELAALERETDDLFAVLDQVGRGDDCGPIATNSLLYDPAIAWRTNRPLAEVGPISDGGNSLVLMRTRQPADAALRVLVRDRRPDAARGRWRAYEVRCRGGV